MDKNNFQNAYLKVIKQDFDENKETNVSITIDLNVDGAAFQENGEFEFSRVMNIITKKVWDSIKNPRASSLIKQQYVSANGHVLDSNGNSCAEYVVQKS